MGRYALMGVISYQVGNWKSSRLSFNENVCREIIDMLLDPTKLTAYPGLL
jgi:hypothetical protein